MAEAAAKPVVPGKTYFHVHLVSDSTGETLSTMLKATAARFEGASPLEHVSTLVRTRKQMNEVLARIESSPGIILYTIADPALRRHLEVKSAELQLPAIPVLNPLLNAFASYLGLEQTMQTAAQHTLDENYFLRIAALDYTLAHDDGQMLWDLESADVVLVGVSRTSKTPTCMYLANRGIKAANVPLVPTNDHPQELETLKKPLVIGLTASPDRLVQIRESRLKNLDQQQATEYSDAAAVRQEVTKAKRLFLRKGWPVIDVTRRSVEETAAQIISKLSAKRAGHD